MPLDMATGEEVPEEYLVAFNDELIDDQSHRPLHLVVQREGLECAGIHVAYSVA